MSDQPDLEALRIERPRGSLRGVPRSPGSSLGWVAGAVGLAALVAAYAGPQAGPREPGAAPGPEVRVESRPRPEAAPVRGMAANGHVVAARRAALSADAPGRIVELTVTEGSRVEAGQVVARLYSDEVRAALARAEADLDAADSEIARARAAVAESQADIARLEAGLASAQAATRAILTQLELARLEDLRVGKLAERKAIDQREIDRARAAQREATANHERARADEDGARAALAHARAGVALREAEARVAESRRGGAAAAVAGARATLEKTEVRAPFAGIVVLKDAEVGEVVSPNVTGGASSRGSIVTMVDPASLEVSVDVPETSLGAVRIGGAVRIFLDAAPDRGYPGEVSRIWPTANRQKATVEVRVRFLEPDDALRPDMGVRAVFLPQDEGDGRTSASPAGPRDGDPVTGGGGT